MAQTQPSEFDSPIATQRPPFGERLLGFFRSQLFQGLVIFVVIYGMLALLQMGIFRNDSLYQIGLITMFNLSMLKFLYLPPLFMYYVWVELYGIWPTVKGYLDKAMTFMERSLGVQE